MLQPSTPDRPIAAWSGLDVPLEVIDAAGFWPSRLTGRAGGGEDAAAALSEGGGHPAMRALLAEILGRGLGPRDRIVFGSTPVAGVWTYNLLLSLGPGAVACRFDLVDIERQDRPSAWARSRWSIAEFAASFAPAPSSEALAAAITDRNRLRRALRALDALRTDRLSGSEARVLFDAADQGPAVLAAPKLEAAVSEIETRPPAGGARIVYSGSGADPTGLYRALEVRGLRVVADDSDLGTRAIGPDVDAGVEPISALADRYRRRDPAPAGWSTQARVAYLVRLAVERGAEAVLFDIPAYDHPSAWDEPAQSAALRKAGVQPIVLPPELKDVDARADACAAAMREAAHV